jgi:preprotein translocase subunit SecD
LKNLSVRLAIVLAVLFISVIYVLPTLKIDIWPHKKINLGLDLQGGMHLVLEVKSEKALENRIERLAHEIKAEMRSNVIKFSTIDIIDKTKIEIKINRDDDSQKVIEFLDEEYKEFEILNKSVGHDSISYILAIPLKESEKIKKMAVEQALETIRNRIDQFGVSEPDIRFQGEKNILVQLPGIKNVNTAKELIGKTALLEFKLVDENYDVQSALEGINIPGSEILYQTEEESGIKIPYLIQKTTLLTGSYLTDARVQIDAKYNEPYVLIEFDRKGARIFEKITEENINKRLAIVLDNNIYSAPVIQEKIGGGVARITGNFTTEKAHLLAIALRAGALPAPVEIIEERTVGPSLGADSINKGLISMCIGGLFVILFMVIYYKTAGLIADIALILNILIIAAGLSAFRATLTLPGIAGIILTIGMAVDANVLIFERIREELRIGKTPHAAVTSGFDRAALTILDANVTTLIAAIVLFQFGTGPVKGFAVTLSMGVLSSLFTALIVSRLVFYYMLLNRKKAKISI